MKKLIILFTLVSLYGNCQEIRMGINLTSYHFKLQHKYNSLNTGGHIEYLHNNWSGHYGFYISSNDNQASYVGVAYRNNINKHLAIGGLVNFTTGYEWETGYKVFPFPMMLIETKFKYVVPTFAVMPHPKWGFVAFQLKFRNLCF